MTKKKTPLEEITALSKGDGEVLDKFTYLISSKVTNAIEKLSVQPISFDDAKLIYEDALKLVEGLALRNLCPDAKI